MVSVHPREEATPEEVRDRSRPMTRGVSELVIERPFQERPGGFTLGTGSLKHLVRGFLVRAGDDLCFGHCDLDGVLHDVVLVRGFDVLLPLHGLYRGEYGQCGVAVLVWQVSIRT